MLFQSLGVAYKWMLNPGKIDSGKAKQSPVPKNCPENLYTAFLGGENVFRLIAPNHFAQLKLELKDANWIDAR